jgi:hypothetical protein
MQDAPGWAARFFRKERELRMAWELERRGRRSTLVGTAHFFPYRFRAALRGRIQRTDTVLLEGPLDDDSRRTPTRWTPGRSAGLRPSSMRPPRRQRRAPSIGTSCAGARRLGRART